MLALAAAAAAPCCTPAAERRRRPLTLVSPPDPPAAVVLPRLPRRHLTVHAAAAAADYAAGSGADPAAGAAPGGPLPRQPRRVCIMVEPSPFTYVCGYMNRYRNTIRFLTEAGVEVLVVTPGPGMTLPGSDFSAAREQVGRDARALGSCCPLARVCRQGDSSQQLRLAMLPCALPFRRRRRRRRCCCCC